MDLFREIYELAGLTDFDVNLSPSEEEGGESKVLISKRLPCSSCGAKDTTFKQKGKRQFLLPPIGATKVRLVVKVKK
jgi:hypothetical protein